MILSHASRPLIFALTPRDPMWQWPAAFVRSHLPRLVEMGRGSAGWARDVEADLAAAQSDPRSLMITPLVLEIIAQRQ